MLANAQTRRQTGMTHASAGLKVAVRVWLDLAAQRSQGYLHARIDSAGASYPIV